MDNAKNFDTHIDIQSPQTYRSYFSQNNNYVNYTLMTDVYTSPSAEKVCNRNVHIMSMHCIESHTSYIHRSTIQQILTAAELVTIGNTIATLE
jgi:hypothetical protein